MLFYNCIGFGSVWFLAVPLMGWLGAGLDDWVFCLFVVGVYSLRGVGCAVGARVLVLRGADALGVNGLGLVVLLGWLGMCC